jgi:GPH family glycoside/pentoside/hexuronide:cation symporter
MSFAVVGTFIGAGAAMPIVGFFAKETTGFSVMGGIFGALMMVVALVTFSSVREPEPEAGPPRKRERFWPTYAQALKNRPFVLLLLPWALFTVGVTVVSGMVSYYFTYIYGFAADDMRTTLALLLLLLSALICIPIWVRIARRVEKKTCYMIGVSIFIVALLVFFFVGHRFGVVSAYVIMVVAGTGLATHYVMPWALIPDVVEYDYAASGERREGVYYGLWTFLVQLGQALGGALIGWILAATGYVAEAVQTLTAQLGIRLLFGPIAAFFFVVGVAILWFYPIDRKTYEEILAKIRRMEGSPGPDTTGA